MMAIRQVSTSFQFFLSASSDAICCLSMGSPLFPFLFPLVYLSMFISTVLGYCHMSRVAYWHSSSLSVLLHLLRQRFSKK
uniref:Uncharacterized protein n=1 Tax=Anguilla anguilla TaxID=7936 RepID=A0A0E9PPG0_ANGAN